MFGILDWIKIGFGAVVGAALATAPVYFYGKSVGRQESRVEAVNMALDRIETMEKNNADYLALPDRDRCLVFMRDSGLPEDNCDQR